MYKHPTLPIKAQVNYWAALGYTCYSNTEVVSAGVFADEKEQCLIIALAETGADDERVIAYALRELQRRREVREQNNAIQQLAKSLDGIRVPADINIAPLERAVDRLVSELNRKPARRFLDTAYEAR